jgi:hypothetical protein
MVGRWSVGIACIAARIDCDEGWSPSLLAVIGLTGVYAEIRRRLLFAMTYLQASTESDSLEMSPE